MENNAVLRGAKGLDKLKKYIAAAEDFKIVTADISKEIKSIEESFWKPQAQSARRGATGASNTARNGQTGPRSAQPSTASKSEPSKSESGRRQGRGRLRTPKKSPQQPGEAPSRPNVRGPGR